MTQLALWAQPEPGPTGKASAASPAPAARVVARDPRSEAARIIRRAVWRKGRVPSSPDRYPWSMARELHAWRSIIERHGVEPELLNRALLHLRELYPRAERVTCLLAVPGLLGDALAAAKASRARAERPAPLFFDPSSREGATPVAAPRQLADVLKGLGL